MWHVVYTLNHTKIELLVHIGLQTTKMKDRRGPPTFNVIMGTHPRRILFRPRTHSLINKS